MKDIRIIGGKVRGRKIKSVPGDSTRPITDKVREALFNIIGMDIQGANFLDLFAGTGSVGIEALSRGAEYACFVDINRLAFNIIRENLSITGMEENATVIRSDAFNFLEKQPDRKFDYVYIAPPQYKKIWIRALEKIDIHKELLSEDAWIIAQIHPIEYVPVGPNFPIKYIYEFEQRHYGDTLLVFYRLVDV